MKIKVWAILLLLTVTACAGSAPQGMKAPSSPHFLSLDPSSLGRSLSLSQLITGEYEDKIYKMRNEVEITPTRLAIVGLSPLGISLFTLVQERDKVTVETVSKEKMAFDPRYILFDFYLTYWPTAVLQKALASEQLVLDESTDKKTRRIRDLHENLVVEITYPSTSTLENDIIIEHFDLPYRLRIKTLEARNVR